MAGAPIGYGSLGSALVRQGDLLYRVDLLGDAFGQEPLWVVVNGHPVSQVKPPESGKRSLGSAKVDGNDLVVYVDRPAEGPLRCDVYFAGVRLAVGCFSDAPPTRAQSVLEAGRQEREHHYRGFHLVVLMEVLGLVAIGFWSPTVALLAGAGLVAFDARYMLR